MTSTQSVKILAFEPFKKLFQDNFTQVIKGQTHLFQVNVDKDLLWNTYLNSFPEELRQQFNCNCCRQFIKNYGNLVAIKNNTLFSLWNFNEGNSVYQTVVDNLDHLVINATVRDVFVTTFAKLGTDSNIQKLEDNSTIRWHHFYYELPKSLVYKGGFSEATVQNEYRSQKEVFKRSLTELTIEATETVLELIAQNSLYRGAEFTGVLQAFLKCQQEYSQLPENQKDNYCWVNSINLNGTVAKIRNTSIGTLLIDISEGVELDVAVTKFEKVMAPTNYKRPTAIFTKKMVEQAEQKITELGLTDSLARRFATANDLTVNNILWKAGNVKTKSDTSLAASLFNELKEDVIVNPKQFSKLESITITDFIEKIVPKVNSIELLLENKHEGNLVSLIAPENLDAPSMFKWDNGFSWSYNKGLADSMKERVKELGGRVDGVLRFTHSWNHNGDNQSLMDLHVFFPSCNYKKQAQGLEIHNNYPSGRRVGWNKREDIYSKAKQDVDFVNAPGKAVPLENIYFPSLQGMEEGTYSMLIHNWSAREPNRSGGKAEIEFNGELYQYDYPQPLKQKQWLHLANVTLKNGQFSIEHILEPGTSSVTSKQLWNINTNKFHKVNMLMYSPNYWGIQQAEDSQQGIGNQHYLFMLDNCKADEARGFFNEFLKQELLPERKVFEALANKMKVALSDDQLSGVGFSSTQKAEFIVKVTGKVSRMLRVMV